MQVLTNNQIQQLNTTAQSAWDALILVEDTFCHGLDRALVALTSDRALNIYRTTWGITKYTVILMAAAAFYAGVLARDVWEFLNDYVEYCQKTVAVEVVEPSEPAPIEPTPDVWELPVESVCLLTSDRAVSTPVTPLLMPAVDVPEVVDVQTRRRAKGSAKKPGASKAKVGV
jgi:hypothetical protein